MGITPPFPFYALENIATPTAVLAEEVAPRPTKGIATGILASLITENAQVVVVQRSLLRIIRLLPNDFPNTVIPTQTSGGVK